jgi:hypothetical protein
VVVVVDVVKVLSEWAGGNDDDGDDGGGHNDGYDDDDDDDDDDDEGQIWSFARSREPSDAKHFANCKDTSANTNQLGAD